MKKLKFKVGGSRYKPGDIVTITATRISNPEIICNNTDYKIDSVANFSENELQSLNSDLLKKRLGIT